MDSPGAHLRLVIMRLKPEQSQLYFSVTCGDAGHSMFGKLGLYQAAFMRRNSTGDAVYIAEHQYATLLFGFFPPFVTYLSMFTQ